MIAIPDAEKTQRVLVSGPSKSFVFVTYFHHVASGKTSAIWQHAFDCAKKGSDVLIICDRAKLARSPPILRPLNFLRDDVEFNETAKAALERIHIKYLSGHAELLRFTSCAHLLQPVPHMIVVEDFRTFFSEDFSQHSMLRLLASLREASAIWTRLLPSDSVCQLVLSEVADSLRDDVYALLMESQIECRVLLGARTDMNADAEFEVHDSRSVLKPTAPAS